jgi:hypothetical protein
MIYIYMKCCIPFSWIVVVLLNAYSCSQSFHTKWWLQYCPWIGKRKGPCECRTGHRGMLFTGCPTVHIVLSTYGKVFVLIVSHISYVIICRDGFLFFVDGWGRIMLLLFWMQLLHSSWQERCNILLTLFSVIYVVHLDAYHGAIRCENHYTVCLWVSNPCFFFPVGLWLYPVRCGLQPGFLSWS